eukprot:6370757-Alexandrium_andersonii.AAC.1
MAPVFLRTHCVQLLQCSARRMRRRHVHQAHSTALPSRAQGRTRAACCYGCAVGRGFGQPTMRHALLA